MSDHFNTPDGFLPCTREWPHEGPCALPSILEGITEELGRMLVAEKNRREELEVVAAALYLGHDDAKDQFDMYRTVYLNQEAK